MLLQISFVYPAMLWGLLALAIPIIIHLYNFRKYKQIYFSDIRLLKQTQEQSKSKSQIKHILILLVRLLFFASLVLAFAQPYFSNNTDTNTSISSSQKTIALYIDNSLSMDIEGSNGTLLNMAKNAATQLIKNEPESSEFLITTNNWQPKYDRFLSKYEALSFIESIKTTPYSHFLSENILRIYNKLKKRQSHKKNVFILSDFQKTTSDIQNIPKNSAIEQHIIAFEGENPSNIFIDSCYFVNPIIMPNKANKLIVKIINNSKNSFEDIPLKLFINNTQKALTSISLLPEEVKEIELSFTVNNSGIQKGKLSIIDAPIQFDDELYFSFYVHKNIAVGIIKGDSAPNYIKKLYQTDSVFSITNISANIINYAELNNYNLLVLNELYSYSSGLITILESYLQQGGHAIYIPAKNMDSVSNSVFFNTLQLPTIEKMINQKFEISNLAYSDALFEGVFVNIPENMDYPNVLKYYNFKQYANTTLKPLLNLSNNDLFLGYKNYKKGRIYLLSSPLNKLYGNFHTHALFVPIMLNIGFISHQKLPLYYTLGKHSILYLNKKHNTELSNNSILKLNAEFDSKIQVIPTLITNGFEKKLFIGNQIEKAGFYYLSYNEAALQEFAFNFQRIESVLNCFTNTELSYKFKNASIAKGNRKNIQEILQKQNNDTIWKWLIIFALFFIIAEILIVKLLK